MPDFAITTDIICGFPGETEDLFEQSLEFIKECQFSGGHVFPFSALEGTAAFSMQEQVQLSIRRDRTAIVRQVLEDAQRTLISRRLGQNAKVLFEGKNKLHGEWVWQGWSEDFIKVFVPSPDNLQNQVVNVVLEYLSESGEVYARVLC